MEGMVEELPTSNRTGRRELAYCSAVGGNTTLVVAPSFLSMLSLMCAAYADCL